MEDNTFHRMAPGSRLDVIKQGKREILLTRSFSAPREQVFRALTVPDDIRQWLRPAGMTLTVCQVDLRPGGTFQYGFETGKGRKLEVRGLYDAVTPPVEYGYTESYDFSPLKIQVTARLQETAGSTTFWQTLVYRSGSERDQDFPGVAESAAGIYGILEGYLRGDRVTG